MGYKNILVHFDNSPAGIKRLDAAAQFAERQGAHLTALALAIEAQRFVGSEAPVPPAILDDLERIAAEEAARDVAALDTVLARLGGTIEKRIVRCWPDEIADVLALHARYADLLVLGQPGHDQASYVDSFVVQDLLMSSGRPILLIPTGGAGPTIGERVLIAWDAGREAARAVSDAMPAIEGARSAHVVTIDAAKSGRHGASPGADIALHLARHGVPVETTALNSGGTDIAELALGWAADHGIDLLVMGAYGHSRVRQLVLGGMTRGMLKRMTLPVLMSH